MPAICHHMVLILFVGRESVDCVDCGDGGESVDGVEGFDTDGGESFDKEDNNKRQVDKKQSPTTQ